MKMDASVYMRCCRYTQKGTCVESVTCLFVRPVNWGGGHLGSYNMWQLLVSNAELGMSCEL
jgi:hypothetical protein